jgi:hypothetical protein
MSHSQKFTPISETIKNLSEEELRKWCKDKAQAWKNSAELEGCTVDAQNIEKQLLERYTRLRNER